MQKWEYLVAKFPKQMASPIWRLETIDDKNPINSMLRLTVSEALKEFGNRGWELVDRTNDANVNLYLYLKKGSE